MFGGGEDGEGGGQLIRYYIKGKIQQLFSAGRIFGVLDKYISLGNRTSIKLFIVRHVFFQSRVWFSSIMPAILMLTTSTNLLLSITIRVMVSVTLWEHYYTLLFMFLPLAWCVFFLIFFYFSLNPMKKQILQEMPMPSSITLSLP